MSPIKILGIAVLCALAAEAPAAQVSAPLSLEAAERLLGEQNPDLAAARIGVKSAEADRAMADHAPNPTLSVSAAYYYPPYLYAPFQNYGRGGATDSTFGISQLFERGDKRALRTEAADKEVAAATFDLKDMKRKLRLTLAQKYFGLAAAEEWEKIARENVDSYGKSVTAMKLRLSAGDISPSDLARMEVEAGQAEISLRRAQNSRLQAQTDLAQILNEAAKSDQIRTGQNLGGDITIPELKKPDFAAIVDKRPDVAGAQSRLDQAHANKKLAQALNKSDLTVGLQYEHGPSGGNISTHNVGVSVSLPWQLFYHNQGEIGQAEAAREGALNQLARARFDALLELQKAWSDLDSAGRQLKNYQGDIVPKAKRAAQAAEFAYQHGSGSLLDLLDARRTLYNLLLDAANAHADYYVARWEWLSATDRAQ